ncbi:hypothetical protein ACFS2C_00510 [Prauserella oleivorans]|uniref:Uncharacterized protein n=1 Tax=Prauserella oleivorans TaxID=1478153 RepID=A0ABW5W5R6_9PSEU
MDPALILVALVVVAAIGTPLWFVLRGRSESRRRARRTAFAQRVGGVEHHHDSGTRPRYGHFPEPDYISGAPFYYALEFTRHGHPVVASESRVRHGPDRPMRYRGIVQLPVRLPAGAPPLEIGSHLPSVWEHTAKTKVDPVADLPGADQGLRARCSDETFARQVVTPTLAAIVTAHKRHGHLPRIVLEHGTIRTWVGGRLAGDDVLRAADLLVEIAQALPQQRSLS